MKVYQIYNGREAGSAPNREHSHCAIHESRLA